MAEEFFKNTKDLEGWIKSRKSGDEAAKDLIDVINIYHKDVNVENNENDIVETCRQIFQDQDNENSDAATTLFGVLAKHNLTTIKEANMKNKITKEAQDSSRQRNGWERGMRNKWNRVVDGFNEGTPWRIDRNKFFNFTHYYTDAVSFNEDPTMVYSGEALWRMYIMDKYSREFQTKEGRWVGGYINDRFYVFPDAGTPGNPETDRMGGNQMELAQDERTRKPRPHQYSVERRMEEARGHKTTDNEVTTANSFNKMVKIASKLPIEKENDKVFNILRDSLDMKEAGIDYEKRLEMISDHYNTSILNVAQIEKAASNLFEKHSGIGYTFDGSASLSGNSEEKSNNITETNGYIEVRDVNSDELFTLEPKTKIKNMSTVYDQEPTYEVVIDGMKRNVKQNTNNNVQKKTNPFNVTQISNTSTLDKPSTSKNPMENKEDETLENGPCPNKIPNPPGLLVTQSPCHLVLIKSQIFQVSLSPSLLVTLP